MSYWGLNAIFLAVVAILAIAAAFRLRTTFGAVGRAVVAILATLVVVVILTAVFDNVIIGIGLVDYDGSTISGVKIGLAPIEDFAYAIAAAVGLPAVWILLSRRPTATAGGNE